ncbi:MAG: SpoIIE family protein phosphatase [Candidatus Eisenbacteria bacterium]|uniref:SpoIIE family protein phosphatase n=1 Tax=Eiseniibacteriota bacterium TaxID=2212470 RepID=A0A956NDH7_UNCEI|nr:SpoIIE family protein phosphatase [Candidatus Eisenbacteria bacterium]
MRRNEIDMANSRSQMRPDEGSGLGTLGQPGHSGPRWGMRWIVSAVAVGLTAAAVLGVGVFQERSTRRALTDELEARLLLEARNLSLASSSALLSDFPELTLHPLLKEKQARNPEFALLVVVDHESKIQGHPEFRRLGETLEVGGDCASYPSTQELDPGESFLQDDSHLLVVAPVEYQGQRIGTTAVGIERGYIDRIIREARLKLLVVLGAFLGLAVIVSFVTMTGLLSPIDDLRRGLERIGRGDLDHAIEVRGRTELGLLANTVNTMAAELKVAQEEMVEKERLAHELDLAREIQSRLLPHERRVTGPFVLDGSHQAAFEVGGDYYDYFSLSGGRTGIVVADVAGKGLAGCLVMSMLAALLKAYRDRYDSPKELLTQLDESLAPDLRPGAFVTMFYGILDESTGQICFASAGHMPTLVYRAEKGEVEEFRTRGIPLGAVRGGVVARTLHDETVQLGPGDLLIQYTDGINETLDVTGETQFEIEGMRTLLTKKSTLGPTAILDVFRDELETWRGGGPRQDDETLVALGWDASIPLTPPQTIPESREEAKVVPIDSALRPPSSTAPESERWLEFAEAQGDRIVLSSKVEAMGSIEPWLRRRADLEDLDGIHFDLLYTALYEACTNIAEHGYGHPNAEFVMWWLPERSRTNSLLGRFVLVDHGRAFSPDNWTASDFHDPMVRRRTRGFGLDIIHRVMCSVNYWPTTSRGNITVLAFDPTAVEIKEVRHA